MKNTKNIIVLGCVIQILCSYLSAQIKIKSINPLPMSERGFINNPVWSMDSKQIAFEFMGKNEKSKVAQRAENQILVMVGCEFNSPEKAIFFCACSQSFTFCDF